MLKGPVKSNGPTMIQGAKEVDISTTTNNN
jgi:hypothetical protein